ncbi:MAG: hypothetical protein Hens3KO_08690 [Henriciella sp.]
MGERQKMPEVDFYPNVKQAASLNNEMHSMLIDSLDYLSQFIDPSPELAQWSDGLRGSNQLRPAGFAAYYDLISALQADDNAGAQKAFKTVLQSARPKAGPAILRLGPDYDYLTVERFQRYMGNGLTGASGIAPVSQAVAAPYEETLRAALDWIAASDPDFSAEFKELISEIILVAPDGTSQNEFEGGSSFRLWGALFLNAEREFTTTELVTSLAHEQGHTVLFGLSRDEMLVENPDSELFWSPIRQSKRPLEGIFHATFVSARMIRILLKLRASNSVSEAERRQTGAQLEETTRIYKEGAQIIRQNARMTMTGQAVMEAMERGMANLLATAL